MHDQISTTTVESAMDGVVQVESPPSASIFHAMLHEFMKSPLPCDHPVAVLTMFADFASKFLSEEAVGYEEDILHGMGIRLKSGAFVTIVPPTEMPGDDHPGYAISARSRRQRP